MKKLETFIMILFVTTVAVLTVHAETKTSWSPVHEQRKAYSEQKKEVYGPKQAANFEGPVGNLISPFQGYHPPMPVKSNVVYRGGPPVLPSKRKVSPPSKELQELKKRRVAARKAAKAQASRSPDVAGTGKPVYMNALPSTVNR